VHRRHLVPLLRRARAAFLVLLRPDAAVALAAVAGFLWLLAQLGPLGELLAGASAFAMFLHELRAAGQGVEHVGLWEFTDFFDDLVFPALRGLAATAILWIPAVAYLAIRSDGPEPLGALLSDPPMALCYAAGWLYAPAALLLAASGRGLLQVMAPDLVVRAAFRLGWDYVVAAACVAGLILAEAGVLRVAGAVAGTGVPLLSGWAAVLLCAYLPAVAARILGIILHVRGDDLGVGSPEQYLDPVLPGALPRGQRRPLPGA
jgi:hypothetical protein